VKKIFLILGKSYIQFLARLILGCIFIYASFHKITDPSQFADIIRNYKLFPEITINFFAVTLPWIELLAGVFLIVGKFVKGSSFILTGLLLIFIIAITINLIRGLNFDCGCFTSNKRGSEPLLLLIRDVIILIPALIISFFSNKKLL